VKLRICALACLVAPLVGCGGAIVGKWELARATPSAVVFALDDVEFHRDGAYEATLTLDGRTMRQQGEYGFNGFKLTLKPRTGGVRRYNAVRHAASLEVSDGDRRVVLRKRSREDTPPAEHDAPSEPDNGAPPAAPSVNGAPRAAPTVKGAPPTASSVKGAAAAPQDAAR